MLNNLFETAKTKESMHTLTGTEFKSDPALQAVIFDCDGILVNTEPLHYKAFQKVLVPLGLGHDYEHYLKHFIGFDDRDAFIYAFKEAGRELAPATLENLIEAKGVALREFVAQGVPTFPGVVDLVKALRAKGILLAVASGALRHEVEAFIASLGLSGAFCAIVAADEVKKSKPDPETYLLAIERLKKLRGSSPLTPKNCIAIEDTPAGICSAKSAGLFVIAVTNSFPEAELSDADLILALLTDFDIPEIIKLLKSRRRVEL